MKISCENKNISYTGRCPQIKDAQWVCHMVRSEYPHVSSSRIKASVSELQENGKVFLPYIIKLQNWRGKHLPKFHKIREKLQSDSKNDFQRTNNVIKQLKNNKFGNCGEDAFLSAAILRMNGIKNVYIANLKTDKQIIDHTVCLFNKDGSEFNKEPDNKTIIIDSWIDSADFASNIFTKYKNTCKNLLSGIKNDSQIGFRDVRKIDISGGEALILTLKHNNFLFPSVNREFMKNIEN